MKKLTTYSLQLTALALFVSLFLSGCIVRTYSVTKDRTDQNISGNRGYLIGSVPAGSQSAPAKSAQRTMRVVEIELRSPVKFERLKEEPVKPMKPQTQDILSSEGNRGYMEGMPAESGQSAPSGMPKFDTYTVAKNDTLQKISARPEIYGTSKKWMKIYRANKDKLKAPDKIRQGQELRIPRD